MSFLNGFASGLSSFAGSAIADAQSRAPSPPPLAAPADAPVAPVDVPPADTAPAAKPGTGIPAGVPPALLAIYQSAARRTGIPVAVLVAQGKQESNFDVNAVGKAGEVGIAQVLPSTARSPGFGMAGVDPSSLKDPRVAINFQADYMRARAGPGADFSHGGTVDAALRAYNGLGAGGDPSYVENVRRHMGST